MELCNVLYKALKYICFWIENSGNTHEKKGKYNEFPQYNNPHSSLVFGRVSRFRSHVDEKFQKTRQTIETSQSSKSGWQQKCWGNKYYSKSKSDCCNDQL